MTLELWIMAYAVVGALTAAVVSWIARHTDPVSSEGSELLLGLPTFLIWPVVWLWIIVGTVIILIKKKRNAQGI